MFMQSDQLARRREKLIARCAEQRHVASTHGQALSHSMSVLETAWHCVERIKQHPGWIIGLVAGIALINPRRLASVARGGALALRTLRMVAPVVQNLRARR